MPDVISDTTPLQYLHQAGYLHFLRQLYKQVTVPQAVVEELRQGQFNGIDVPLLHRLEWITIQRASPADLQRIPTGLDAGEREAVALAMGKSDPLLLLDDAAARRQAKALSLPFTGTLRVLLKTKRARLITEVRPALDRLHDAGFYLGADVRAQTLRLAGEFP